MFIHIQLNACARLFGVYFAMEEKLDAHMIQANIYLWCVLTKKRGPAFFHPYLSSSILFQLDKQIVA